MIKALVLVYLWIILIGLILLKILTTNIRKEATTREALLIMCEEDDNIVDKEKFVDEIIENMGAPSLKEILLFLIPIYNIYFLFIVLISLISLKKFPKATRENVLEKARKVADKQNDK